MLGATGFRQLTRATPASKSPGRSRLCPRHVAPKKVRLGIAVAPASTPDGMRNALDRPTLCVIRIKLHKKFPCQPSVAKTRKKDPEAGDFRWECNTGLRTLWSHTQHFNNTFSKHLPVSNPLRQDPRERRAEAQQLKARGLAAPGKDSGCSARGYGKLTRARPSATSHGFRSTRRATSGDRDAPAVDAGSRFLTNPPSVQC